jgi:hypothetical protein
MDLPTVGFVLLVGYTVGDLVAPVRRTVVQSLESTREAVENDVDESEDS